MARVLGALGNKLLDTKVAPYHQGVVAVYAKTTCNLIQFLK